MNLLSQRFKVRRPRSHRRLAFTLVEMMVAMGLITFILLVLVQMVDATSKAWNSGSRRVDAFREARAALNIIERDFAGLKTDWYNRSELSNPANFKNVKSLPIYLDDAAKLTEISNFNLKGTIKANTQTVFFLTTTGDLSISPADRKAENGDLCQIGYYAAYAEDGESGRKIFKLYRYSKTSKETFGRIYRYLNASDSVTQANFLESKGDDVHEALAFNVTDFTVKAYYYDSTGKVEEFDPEEAVKPLPPAVLEAGDDPADYSTMPARPDFLEITLGVLGNQSVAKLPKDSAAAWSRAPLGSGLPTDLEGRVVSSEARIFTTRIDLR